ncbi:MAG: hypothetical protein B1H04_01340 [Planctomycetales bacterium 4484_123]|nr:MAG: hypothetical protein B1H04_01340 [Planctomycetales bacterium 4484_123]
MVSSRNIISDILAFDALKETTFCLMDIDRRRLEVVGAMAESINRTRGAGARIVTTTDRRAAIDGADHVINTVGVGGFEATCKDIEVPASFGLRQVIGDTLCVGGIFRALRSPPVLLEMVRGMEQLAPEALLLNYTNPMAMHVRAVLERDRRYVYHAAMLDPNTAATLTLAEIHELVDAMFAAHGELIPPYLRAKN